MEFVEGPDLGSYLKTLIKQKTWLPFEQARELIEQVLEALEYAQDKRIVHGDIKPGNILLPETGQVKLGDFGVAKILGAANETAHSYGEEHKRMLGSPTYSAPEVLKGGHRDFQSDLFSVGMLAYMLFTRQHPFKSFEDKSGLFSISELIRDETCIPPKISDIQKEIPEKYAKIVMCLLERDKGKRYETAKEVLDEWREKTETAPCPNCTAKNPVSQKFCGECGKDLREVGGLKGEKDLSSSFSLFHEGKSDEAIKIMQKSLKTNKRFAEGWSHLGYMLNFERKYEEAEEACTFSIEINKEDAQPYWTRGFARSNLGKLDEAIADFTEALNKEPDPYKQSQILNHRAKAWRFAGNYDKAISDVNSALKIDPGNAKALAMKEQLQPLLKKG